MIYINGEEQPLAGPTTIKDLLHELGLADKRLAVEVNHEIIPRSRHSDFELKPKDRIEVVNAIGGG